MRTLKFLKELKESQSLLYWRLVCKNGTMSVEQYINRSQSLLCWRLVCKNNLAMESLAVLSRSPCCVGGSAGGRTSGL